MISCVISSCIKRYKLLHQSLASYDTWVHNSHVQQLANRLCSGSQRTRVRDSYASVQSRAHAMLKRNGIARPILGTREETEK